MMDHSITDKSFNAYEVTAATTAIVGFIGDVGAAATVDDLIEVIDTQLESIWHIMDETVRQTIAITAFAVYGIDIT